MLRRLLFTLLASALVALVLGAAALGDEVAGITIDDAHLHVVGKYGPIVGNDPAAGQVQDPTLSQCQTLPGHDAVPITIKITHAATTKETFATSWPRTGSGTAASNDVDVYFFQDDGTEIGRSAGSGDPETINLAGLPDGKYWVCAVNFSGANTGLNVDVKADRLNLYHYVPPPPTPVPNTPGKGAPQPTDTPLPAIAKAAPSTPSVTPEVVATPGPNGPVTGQQLDALSGSQQASAHKQGHSGLSIALGVATILIALSGAGVVVLRIRRDTT